MIHVEIVVSAQLFCRAMSLRAVVSPVLAFRCEAFPPVLSRFCNNNHPETNTVAISFSFEIPVCHHTWMFSRLRGSYCWQMLSPMTDSVFATVAMLSPCFKCVFLDFCCVLSLLCSILLVDVALLLWQPGREGKGLRRLKWKSD